MRKFKFLKSVKVFSIVFGVFFCAAITSIIPCKALAGGEDKEITGNRGYLLGGPSDTPKVEKKDTKGSGIKREGVKPEFFKQKAVEIEENTRKAKAADQVIPADKGNIAPKGYILGTPKPKQSVTEKKRGRGGFATGWNRAMDDLKEFNEKIKSKPYPADRNVERMKGNYIYGEPPAEKPEPQKQLTRTRGMKPTEIIPLIGKGIENLHNSWSIKPHRSEDKEIWGFKFPDMPKKEKKGITKHRGDPVKTIQSFIEGVGADIEKHKASAPMDK